LAAILRMLVSLRSREYWR